MNEYLLDTNHVSPLVTIGYPLRERVFERIDAGDKFAVCVPVVTETLFGIGILPRAKQNREQWTRLMQLLPCYIPDESDAEFAGNLRISLRSRGWQLETVDALIASVALRHGITVLTTDKDFRGVPNLQHENWLKLSTE